LTLCANIAIVSKSDPESYQFIYIIKELVPGKYRSKKKKSFSAAFWEGIFLTEFFNRKRK
jgi:hypothetical protein